MQDTHHSFGIFRWVTGVDYKLMFDVRVSRSLKLDQFWQHTPGMMGPSISLVRVLSVMPEAYGVNSFALP